MSQSNKEVGLLNLDRHLLQNIFCELPIKSLINVSLVCKALNEVNDAQFLPHKKLYYRDQATDNFAVSIVKDLIDLEGCTDSRGRPECYVIFARWAACFKRSGAGSTADRILAALNTIPPIKKLYYLLAPIPNLKQCLLDPENVGSGLQPFAFLGVYLFYAPDSHSILYILELLLPIDRPLVIDFFYAAALFFRAFHRCYNIPERHHEDVYSGLYLLQNPSHESRHLLRSIFDRHSEGRFDFDIFVERKDDVILTNEQIRVVESDIGVGKTFKIVAYAGAGKTTTLRRYAQARPGTSFLFVCFDQQIAEEASSKFPPNVTSMTTYHLASREVGRRYLVKNKDGKHKFKDNFTAYDVMKVLPNPHTFAPVGRAKAVLETLEHFWASQDDEVCLEHVQILGRDRHQHYEDAKVLWHAMKDASDFSVPMTHDGYLKLYQLSRPNLCKYDVILIDDANDMTSCEIGIFNNQPTAARIWVGNSYQQICPFRGAINAMEFVAADSSFYLTQSFLYDPQISLSSKTLLQSLKKERKKKRSSPSVFLSHSLPLFSPL